MKPLEGILGNTVELRLLEFLLPLKDISYNAIELAGYIDASVARTVKAADNMARWDILKVSRNSEPRQLRNTLYAINPESKIVKAILELDNAIIETILDRDEK